jgi:sterol desaturase/sphingolipid hydroxylase (fatty acid hydroxylase superfamily)
MSDVLGWFRIGIWDYPCWLLAVSLLCFALERVFPWRREQRVLRLGFWQDLGWLALNGYVLAILLGKGQSWLASTAALRPLLEKIESVNLLIHAPFAVQFVVLLVGKDLIEWCIHNLLHRVPWLWSFHQVHHGIVELDWLGNFHFHWFEIVIYRSLTYLPLAVFGFSGPVILTVAVTATLIGHLNHSNLPIGWGPFRYVLNSPKFHVWHHDLIARGEHGRNFGIVFSAWDWIFRTAEMPPGQPARLGFEGMEKFPRTLIGRLLHPLQGLFVRE